jgi:hypothetical protein
MVVCTILTSKKKKKEVFAGLVYLSILRTTAIRSAGKLAEVMYSMVFEMVEVLEMEVWVVVSVVETLWTSSWSSIH